MVNLNNKTNILVLITSGFPFDNHENYLETEIIYLAKRFSKILILSNNTSSKNCRQVPNNVQIKRIRYNSNFIEKILSIRQVFNKSFVEELGIIKSQYKIKVSIGILKTLLITLGNSHRLRKEYESQIQNINNENITFYSYWCNDSAIALSKLKVLKGNNISCITRMHRWDIYFEESKYGYLPLRKDIFKNLDSVVSISQDGINYLKSRLKFNTKSIKVSRLGVKKIGEFHKKVSKKFLIVSCSNLIKVKQVHLIAESLSKIKNHEINWVHFGDGILMDEIINYCEKNLPKNIKVEFKGRVSNKEVVGFYIKNVPDLFINLSSSEGVPMSIMEAMSCSIPVIATNVGGTSEIVNNENGLLLKKSFEIGEVSKFIEKFYTLKIKEKETLRKNAYETWSESFDASKNYNNFIKEFLYSSG
jgi:colanic acid/amylovoran biosynthesis glycosyltransferase